MAGTNDVWMVGGGTDFNAGAVGTIFHSADFATATPIPRAALGTNKPKPLYAVWATTSGVDAFGDGGTHVHGTSLASWASVSLSVPTRTSPPDFRGAWMVGPSDWYLAGVELSGGALLARWDGGTGCGEIYAGGSTSSAWQAVAYLGTNHGYVAGDRDVFRHHDWPNNLDMASINGMTTGSFTAISTQGTTLLTVGMVIDPPPAVPISAPAAFLIDSAATPLPKAVRVANFTQLGTSQPNGAFLAPKGFAVVVANGGQILESQDGGKTWTSKPSSSTVKLNAVHCSDENHCVAVGDGAEILFYENQPPDPPTLQTSTFLEGSQVKLMATASDPDSDTIKSYSWTALDLIPGNPLAGQTGASIPDFTAPATHCGNVQYRIEIVASDGRLSSQPATVTLEIADLRANPTNVAISPAPLVFQLGQHNVVSASGSSECNDSLDFTWSSLPGGLAPTVTTPSKNVSEATYDLTSFTGCPTSSDRISVTATDKNGTQLADGTWPNTKVSAPVTVAADFVKPAIGANGVPTSVKAGEWAEISIVATHPCTASLHYGWACTGTSEQPGDVATFKFTNPGTNCTPATVRCEVTVTPAVGAADKTAFSFTYDPPTAPTDLGGAFDRGTSLAAGQSTTWTASQPPPACFTYAWSCTGKGVTTPPRDSTTVTFAHPGAPLCAAETAGCTLTVEPTAGGQPSATYSFGVDYQPAFSPPTLDPPSAQNFEPGQEVPASCDSPLPVTIRPTVQAGCSPTFSWKQLTDLPVAMQDLGGGALSLTPLDFAATVGRTGRFELRVENSMGKAAQQYEVTFAPPRYVKLDHQSDRPSALPGETVTMRVGFSHDPGCQPPLDGIDLHLALNGLSYVAGGARFNGAELADPERSADELIFRKVPVTGERAELSYRVRRSGLSGRVATSAAKAYLSVMPEVVISKEARAGQGADEPAPLSCHCQSGGGPLLAGWSLLGMAVLSRRRRPRAHGESKPSDDRGGAGAAAGRVRA